MRKICYILSALLFVLLSIESYAKGSTNDTSKFPITSAVNGQIHWPGGDVSKNTTVVLPSFSHTNSAGNTINDISIQLKAQITIKKGYTLTIKMDPQSTWSQRAIIVIDDEFAASSKCMFLVEQGASLVIEGLDNSTKYIGIKGSRNTKNLATIYDSTTKEWTKPSGYEEYYNKFPAGYGMITTRGNVTMKYVRMYDSYCQNDGSALVVQRNDSETSLIEYGKVTLTDCNITNCVATFGPALVIYNQVKNNPSGDEVVDPTTNSKYNPENSVITLTNCKISNNYSTLNNNVCGAIRTGGGAYSNLKLINTEITGNYAEGKCAGIVWNAHGLSNQRTVCTLDGCSIENNYSKGNAAGLYLSSSFEFVNNDTYIRGNTSDANGGGVYIVSYTGVDGMEGYPQTLDLSFSKFARITNNTAVKGAGMYIEDSKTNDLGSGSTINVSIDGAEVSNNIATGNGGGVYFYANNNTINFNFNLNSGSIKDNTAKNGAGFYGTSETDPAAYSLDKNLVKLNFNGGTVSGCNASVDGGGIYVYGLMISCDAANQNGVVVNSNHATGDKSEGGGVYLTDGAEMTIRNGIIGGESSSLKNSAYNGGGIFLNNGSTLHLIGGSVSYNESKTNGGGVYVKAGSSFSLKGATISHNTTKTYGGGVYAIGCTSFNLTDGIISDNASTTGNGGGIFITGESDDVIISGGKIINNHADAGIGGGIVVNSTKGVTIIGGEISGNTAKNGGGVSIAKNLTMDGGTIKGNFASEKGAGVYLYNSATFNHKQGSIIENKPTDGSLISGGGIYMDNGTLNILGGSVSDNKSTQYGGGIFVNAGTVLVDKGQINRNKCVRDGDGTGFGGGMYINGSSAVVTVNGGTFDANSAYNGGALCVIDGTVKITGGEITNNEAGFQGGGICYKSPIDMIISNGVIKGNSAESFGGGISIEVPDYTAESTSKMTVSGGSITNNVSENGRGGGVSVKQGSIEITGGDITANQARVGGGVHIGCGSYAKMSFGDGVIRNNRASGSKSFTTGYQKDQSNLAGVGGGIYIDKKSSLTFVKGSQIGLYNNIADKMGDDIFSSGVDNSITLPYVGEMDLSDYDSKTPELYWVEDYMTNDTGYPNISSAAPAGYKAVRYRDAIAAQSKVYPLDVPSGGKTYTNTYLALSLGYEIIYVTLKKIGLQPGESAIFRISKVENDASSTPYTDLLVTGNGGELTKKVALYSGKWKIEETGWSWAYDSPASITRSITGSSTAQDKIFVFENQKREGLPLHHEDIVVNDFDKNSPTTGSFVNTGQIKDLNEKSQQMK